MQTVFMKKPLHVLVSYAAHPSSFISVLVKSVIIGRLCISVHFTHIVYGCCFYPSLCDWLIA